MSEILDEQLSAFLDGELPPEELDLVLTRLDRDATHRARLGRYALIGECLRTGSAQPAALQLAERVRAQLAEAPVEEGRSGVRASGSSWSWLKLAGAAAAAATVALLVAQPGAWQGAGEAQLAGRGPAQTAGRVEEISTVSSALARRLDPRSAARLTGYLVAHGEYANQFSRNTLDSHLVTARAERAAWRQAQGPADVR